MRQSVPAVSYDSARTQLQALVEAQEVWRYRSLVRNLVSRDLKVRYKRSALGFVWVTLNPLLTTIVLSIAFSYLIGSSQPYYPVFVLAGLVIWNLFAQGSVAAMSNLVGNGSTLRRMYIPPSVFVISAVGSALVNLVFTLIPLVLIALAMRVPFHLTWLYIPIACVQVTIFTLGVGLIISTMSVFFNDIYEMYLVLITAFNYLTPVFYPINILPIWLQRIEVYNPMYLFVSAAQTAIVGSTVTVGGTLVQGRLVGGTSVTLPPAIPDLKVQLITWASAFLVFTIGWLLFTRTEAKFAYHF
ncbi:MAG TPA: ABC transporter permease [Ktedonobacterales bacterium]|nr:ABC transporter permease [Ktedonobacterales bacterium]